MSEYCQPSARFEMSGISPVGHDRGANVAKLATPLPSPAPQGGREQAEFAALTGTCCSILAA